MPLGEGGFGITYRAQCCSGPHKGKQVVIKTLRDKIIRDRNFERYQQDFVNEALRVARCQHPHIVQVYEVVQEWIDVAPQPRKRDLIGQWLNQNPPQQTQRVGLWCLVLEYIEGQTLADILGNSQGKIPPLPLDQAMAYVQQLGSALGVVHGQGLVHRDIKPHNIMIRTGSQEAVLIDFGLTRHFAPSQSYRPTKGGSEGFRAPEQFQSDEEEGAFTDVYGLAATLYCLVTGADPVDSLARQLQILKGKPDPLIAPQTLNRNLSQGLGDAIVEGMRMETYRRPETVELWLDQLNATLSPPVVMPPIRPWVSAHSVTPPPVPDPTRSAAEWFAEGNNLYNLGRYEEAIASYDRALAIDKNYKLAWNNRGSSLDDLGRYEAKYRTKKRGTVEKRDGVLERDLTGDAAGDPGQSEKYSWFYVHGF